jgi:chorismate synthase
MFTGDLMLRFLTAGESHGPSLTAILDGVPAGLPLTPDNINKELARRQKGYGSGGRMKIENDTVQILGGVMAGETTGAPIAMLVENADHIKWKGKAIEPMTAPRPGHADLTGAVKYGYRDLRPALERASARETTMRVAAGAVCKHFLAQFNILVGGYVTSIGGVQADFGDMPYEERFQRAEESDVRCPDPMSAQKMREEIEKAIHGKNTLGGMSRNRCAQSPSRTWEFHAMGQAPRSKTCDGGHVRASHQRCRSWRRVRKCQTTRNRSPRPNNVGTCKRSTFDEQSGRHRGRNFQRTAHPHPRRDETDRHDADTSTNC